MASLPAKSVLPPRSTGSLNTAIPAQAVPESAELRRWYSMAIPIRQACTPSCFACLRTRASPRIPHRDDRVATVISGTWHIGYGDSFDESKLKALPPGSFYTEPPGRPHFARTGDEPVVVQITGFGPSSTDYVDPAQDPRRPH